MKSKTKLIVLFLLPAVLLYGGLFLVPTLESFRYSLFDFSGFTEAQDFVGLRNFKDLMTDPVFWMSLRNSLSILAVGGVFTFALAFLISAMMNSGVKGKKFFRAAIFLPNVVATIALTTMWMFAIYSSTSGILPNAFKAMGFTKAAEFMWMAPEHIFTSAMVAIIWASVGYYVVLLLAGMDKVPTELYEAAKLEGAGGVRVFFSITVPLIWDVITISIVTWGIGALKVFEFPFSFMGAGEDPHLYTLNVYLYIMGFGKRNPIYRLGYAAAIGVILILIAFLFSAIVRRIMRRDVIQY